MGRDELLQAIPSVDRALRYLAERELGVERPRPILVAAVRAALAAERKRVLSSSSTDADVGRFRTALLERLEKSIESSGRLRLVRVVNATGIIVHTNLGRAPLSTAAVEEIRKLAAGYMNLEYDLISGRRGSRHDLVREAIRELTGAEDALVVNNNAAAVMLALNTLADGREVPVSRGELIEIGGSFRLPEVFARSGATMVEVGTTNRTRISDFERAIRQRTAALMTAHWSNYAIIGFVDRVPLSDLVRIGDRCGLPVIHDLGSGALSDPSEAGLPGELTVRDSVRSGAAVSTFSGDKLLGGPQAGIAVGRADVIARMRANPLLRALRPGKLTFAALQATLDHYLNGEAETSVPVLRSIAATSEALASRAAALADEIASSCGSRATASSVETTSRVGGGASPEAELPSSGVAVTPDSISVDDLRARLLEAIPPVVARVSDDAVVIDLRTVEPEDDRAIAAALKEALAGND